MSDIDALKHAIKEIGIIHPGDTLILASDIRLTSEQALSIKTQVQELIPDIHVVILSGLQATIVRP
jgi:hypothetical protein